MDKTTRKDDLVNLIEFAEEGFSHYKSDFQQIEQMYHCEMDSDVAEYLADNEKSGLYFGKAQAKSRRISDSLLKNYFGNDKFATILSSSENEEMVKAASATEKEVQAQLNNRRFFTSVVNGLYRVPYTGTIITRSYWADGIVTEDINVQDFFFDRDAISQDDLRYAVHNVYVAIEDIKRMQREGSYARDIDIEQLITEDDTKSYTRVKLQEIYTKVGDEWKVSTVYDKNHFFRLDVTLKDGFPFSWGGLLPQSKKIDEENYVSNYFAPILASIKSLQDEYNSRRNQIIDAVKQSLNPKLLVPTRSGINPLDFKKPIGYIPVKDPSQIVVLPTADYRGGMQDISFIDTEMSEISGVNPMMNGVSSQKSKTATQTGVEHTEGSLKLEIYTRHLNETYFEQLIRRISKLCWKYGKEDNFIGVDRETTPDLKVSFNTGLGVINDIVKADLLDKNFSRLERLFNYQLQVQQDKALITLNGMAKLTREGLALSGIKNADEYLGEEVKLGDIKEEQKVLQEKQEQERMAQLQEQMPMQEQMQEQPIEEGYEYAN